MQLKARREVLDRAFVFFERSGGSRASSRRAPILSFAWLTLGLFLCFAPVLQAATDRGVWFWDDPTYPFGSVNVVGNHAQETTAINEFLRWQIKHIYGSYGNCTTPDIAAWNQQLHANGLTSQLLLSENTWIDPKYRTSLLTLIQTNLLDFNNTQAVDARFDGLHLDIEPNGLPGWTGWSPAKKKAKFYLLRDTYQAVRTYLDSNGGTLIPVYADLAVWYDQLSGPIGWTNGAERDACFTAITSTVTEISLMAFERPTLAAIQAGVRYETGTYPGKFRGALETNIGASPHTWPDFTAFMNMVGQVEGAYPGLGLDIQDFAQFETFAPPP